MEVLYIVGTCLTKNTSANMSHNSFVQGLLENKCNVEIIMANDSWGIEDSGLPIWSKVKYNKYNSICISEHLRRGVKHLENKCTENKHIEKKEENNEVQPNIVIEKNRIRIFLKNIFYKVFPKDLVYPLDKKWIKEAKVYKNSKVFDLVISNSSPAASHRLAELLIKSGNICTKRWVQIWEDPWYFDLYGGHSEEVKNEEHRLLRAATEVYYVSPITLEYQKLNFLDCAEKMKFIPLPALEYENDIDKNSALNIKYGYFGDYYSKTRNLRPFYNAARMQAIQADIYGDSDLNLQSTNTINVSGRITLSELSVVQQNTDVLVHLCNLKGGQIPGKIYHYSLTKKPILFILDGTEDEQKWIYNFFAKYNRYYFCENNEKSIINAMKKINDEIHEKEWKIVKEFAPQKVVEKIILNKDK